MENICIGMVGAGYAAQLHGGGYKSVSGVPFRLKAVTDVDPDKAAAVRERYGFEAVAADFDELLRDGEINVIDIVTPPFLHSDMIERALAAGKHVICEKPLTGYFGRAGDKTPIGDAVPRERMYDAVLRDMHRLREVVKSSGRKFMYAENYVYSTPVLRAADIIRRRGSRILFLKGEESLKGSSSPVAGEWRYTGGGTLIRAGCHPLSGVLWLKKQEAQARGEDIRVTRVTADTGRATAVLGEHEHRHISARPMDVEDFANVTMTFSDGTKAVVMASDTVLGGTRNYIEVFCNDCALMCNITPTDLLNTYFLDEQGMDGVEISEMLPQKLGWNKVFVSDEIIRGYRGEMQDFMEAVYFDREPLSGFELAYDTIQAIYAAYLSAGEGRAVTL